jgi:hypothetical protein
MVPVARLEVFRGVSVGIPPIFVRYRMTFLMGLVTQLQLWHSHWLVPVRSVSDLHLQVPYALQFTSHRDAAAISISIWMT